METIVKIALNPPYSMLTSPSGLHKISPHVCHLPLICSNMDKMKYYGQISRKQLESRFSYVQATE